MGHAGYVELRRIMEGEVFDKDLRSPILLPFIDDSVHIVAAELFAAVEYEDG